MRVERDVFNYANIHLIVGTYFFMTSEVKIATIYIEKAVETIETHPQHFLWPTKSEPWVPGYLESSVDVQEHLFLMANIVIFQSLLQIHLLEKKSSTIENDVLKNISVRVLLVADLHLILLSTYPWFTEI